MVQKKDIRTLTLAELELLFEQHQEKAFRAKQVYEWLWQKSIVDFQQMSNLSLPLRHFLENNFLIQPIQLQQRQISNDKTIKNAFQLHDKHVIETVLIPTEKRMTVCVSSQVGCSLTCSFCATGKLKRLRNLTAAEIYDQVVFVQKQALEFYQKPLTNIVYMGMGEPLLNYQNTLDSIAHITHAKYGLGWSPSRITVSTAGIAKMIQKLGDDQVKFNLALSLHAANDEKRNQIMPINEQNHLRILRDALRYFYEKTGNEITLEYIIFKHFNDELKDAQELWDFCKHVPCKINIIEYNSIDDALFQQADPEKVNVFAQFLKQKNMIVNIRRSRGKDIDAACGQLANKNRT
ncbi:MAG: 23S rRNA (adenine(2503)-C(2))-methyltransferase RlmN [Bacteroidota bacterium]